MSEPESGAMMPDKEEKPATLESSEKDAPPSKESSAAKIRKKNTSAAEFTRNAYRVCSAVVSGSVLGLILLGLATALPISMIVIGRIYLNDCPVERYIPIYLIVGGSFGLLYFVLNLCNRVQSRKEDGESPNRGITCTLSLVSCFTTAWFIAGNVWVYRTYSIRSPHPMATNYCHQTLYLFAFWQITSCYILLGVILVLGAFCAGVRIGRR